MRGKELLLRVKQHILEDPRRLDMSVGLVKKDGDFSLAFPPSSWPECGTVGCIAGWIVQLGNPLFAETKPHYWESIVSEARQLLSPFKKSYSDVSLLFYTGSWRKNFREVYTAANDLETKAKVTGMVIDEFIAENYPEN